MSDSAHMVDRARAASEGGMQPVSQDDSYAGEVRIVERAAPRTQSARAMASGRGSAREEWGSVVPLLQIRLTLGLDPHWTVDGAEPQPPRHYSCSLYGAGHYHAGKHSCILVAGPGGERGECEGERRGWRVRGVCCRYPSMTCVRFAWATYCSALVVCLTL